MPPTGTGDFLVACSGLTGETSIPPTPNRRQESCRYPYPGGRHSRPTPYGLECSRASLDSANHAAVPVPWDVHHGILPRRDCRIRRLNDLRRICDDDEHPLACGPDSVLPLPGTGCAFPELDHSCGSNSLSRAAESRGSGSVRIPTDLRRQGQPPAPIPIRGRGGRRAAGIGGVPGGGSSNPPSTSGTRSGRCSSRVRSGAPAGPRTLSSDPRLHSKGSPGEDLASLAHRLVGRYPGSGQISRDRHGKTGAGRPDPVYDRPSDPGPELGGSGPGSPGLHRRQRGRGGALAGRRVRRSRSYRWRWISWKPGPGAGDPPPLRSA